MSQFKLSIYNISSNGNDYKKICEIGGEKEKFISCCWSHPNIGNLLGAASLNGKVNIYKENHSGTSYESIYSIGDQSTVNCITFNSNNLSVDFELCIGYSNGDLGVVFYFQDKWGYKKRKGHKYGINSIVCGNFQDRALMFSCGNDSLIKVWNIQNFDFEFALTLEKVHSGPVTSLAIVEKEVEKTNSDLISFGNKEEVFYWDINEIVTNNKSVYYKLNTNNFTQTINSISPSLCGKYFTFSNSDGVNLFRSNKTEGTLLSSTGNDGTFVDKE